MDTESPAQRLTRRIGTDPDPADAAGEDSDTVLARWLPDTGERTARDWIAGLRADPGRAGVVALLAVGVIAVLVTVFTVMRDSRPPVSAANLPAVQMVSSASPTPSPQPPPDGPVVVSVVGLVRTPGLVTVTAGARIADALEAAGGAVDGADLVGLNLARRVADGEQIIVGLAAPAGSPSPMGSSIAAAGAAEASPGTGSAPPGQSTGAKPTGPVDLNTATAEELDALPGVGPVTAAAIIAWREANGRFTSVDQLGEVDGIGPARLDKLRDLVVA